MLLIPAGNPSLWTGPTGTNTYLLRGAVPTLIDAGVGNAPHIAAVEQHLAGQELAQVLLTHTHSDHAGGVPAVLARWPDASIRSSPSAPFTDGETLLAGGGSLTALHTPGHAPDHFCFLNEASGEVYCGDLVRAGGTIVIPANRGGDLRAYLRSLERLRSMRPKRLLPGHGPAIDDPDAAIAEYLAHRAQREAEIIDALRSGLTRPAEIVPRIYGRLAAMIVRAAEESVLAHLRKLEADGLATEENGRWVLGSSAAALQTHRRSREGERTKHTGEKENGRQGSK